MYTRDFNLLSFMSTSARIVSIEAIIGLIVGIVAFILGIVLVFYAKKNDIKNPVLKWLRDLIEFKFLFVEKILKGLWLLAACIITGIGFFTLFGPGFLGGLILLVLGNVIARLVYELIMVQILLLSNTQQINKKLGNGTNNVQGDIPADDIQPEVPVEPDWRFCSQCGAKYDANKGGCPRGCE